MFASIMQALDCAKAGTSLRLMFFFALSKHLVTVLPGTSNSAENNEDKGQGEITAYLTTAHQQLLRWLQYLGR